MAKENEKRPYVCLAEFAGSLDNSLRRLVHKPRRILETHVGKGMSVLDLGCGPGYFTIELAKLVGEEGRVIAADLQQGMLDKVAGKIRGTDLEQRVEIHKCQDDLIGISQKVDFVLAFWMVHEVADQDKLFRELKSVLKPDGKIYITEPKLHVSLKSFGTMINRIENSGFEISEGPKVVFSRTVLLKIR
ncbi:MAG TPA: class I SAM-dependent methyltransferase [Bacteroidales bacterium]|nr:class I SAM-dependent methyltransferase [Bacteroidales bacterium]